MKTDELKNKAAEHNGVYESRYSTGQLRERSNYKNGKLDGPAELWFENGQIWRRANYKADELDGSVELWYENGQMKERRNYKAGKLDGLYEWWDGNGQMWGRVSYKDGRVVEALPVAPDDRGTPAPQRRHISGEVPSLKLTEDEAKREVEA